MSGIRECRSAADVRPGYECINGIEARRCESQADAHPGKDCVNGFEVPNIRCSTSSDVPRGYLCMNGTAFPAALAGLTPPSGRCSAPVCGNGIREDAELCDGSDFGDLSTPPGSVTSCNATCDTVTITTRR